MFKEVTKDNIKDFKNFKLNELKCKCNGKYCNGFPVNFSYELLENLQDIRNHYNKPVYITSGIRCQKYNDSLKGSVKNSKHIHGCAADFYVQGITYNNLRSYIKKFKNYNYAYNISGSVMHYDIKPSNITDKYNLTRLLKPGCRGNDVKDLQTELQKRGYDLGKYGIDGIFGKSTSYTSKAVKSFQKDNKLIDDGIVGINTAHKLNWLYRGN